ncbi:hypothetical protein [Nocardia sp. NPDC019302]|uniref:hypothetical protein n=1 Tax=Nocardia sp. NPDC019302 TaxID=3154592 RepID=UPI003401A7AF
MTGIPNMVDYDTLDALKYLIRRVEDTVDWTTDSLFGKGISSDDHPEIEAISQLVDVIGDILGPLSEAWGHYADGREIVTRVEIEDGHGFEHVWHPDPAKNQPKVVTGKLLADPGEDNGTYEIRITPPQSVEVRTFPRGLRVVKP